MAFCAAGILVARQWYPSLVAEEVWWQERRSFTLGLIVKTDPRPLLSLAASTHNHLIAVGTELANSSAHVQLWYETGW